MERCCILSPDQTGYPDQRLHPSISSVILEGMPALKDALAKSQTPLHFLQILWPLPMILLSGPTNSNKDSLSKVALQNYLFKVTPYSAY